MSFPPRTSLASWTAASALALLAGGALAACEDTSPSPGEACAAGGGVCMSGGCADSLPQFDCGSGQYCCRPPPRDGGR